MKPVRGDRGHLWCLLTVSLLVHLSLVIALNRVAGIDAGRQAPVAFLVELVHLAGSTSGQQNEATVPNLAEPGESVPVKGTAALPVPLPSIPVVQAATEQAAVTVPATATAGQRATSAVTGGSVRASQPSGTTAGIAGTGGQHGGAGANDKPAMAKTTLKPLPGGYQAVLKRLIDANKVYPFAARRAGQTGSCLRRFVLGRNGAVNRVDVLSSCGYPFLDEAATQAINSVGKFPPLPDDIEGSEAAFTVTISFNLANR